MYMSHGNQRKLADFILNVSLVWNTLSLRMHKLLRAKELCWLKTTGGIVSNFEDLHQFVYKCSFASTVVGIAQHFHECSSCNLRRCCKNISDVDHDGAIYMVCYGCTMMLQSVKSTVDGIQFSSFFHSPTGDSWLIWMCSLGHLILDCIQCKTCACYCR